MTFEPFRGDSSKGRQEEDLTDWWANNKTITVFALRPTSVLIDYLNSKCQLQVLSFCSSSWVRELVWIEEKKEIQQWNRLSELRHGTSV